MSYEKPHPQDLVTYRGKIRKLVGELESPITRPDRVIAIMYQIRNNAQRYIRAQYKIWEKEND